jgi:hypothetical protein
LERRDCKWQAMGGWRSQGVRGMDGTEKAFRGIRTFQKENLSVHSSVCIVPQREKIALFTGDKGRIP